LGSRFRSPRAHPRARSGWARAACARLTEAPITPRRSPVATRSPSGPPSRTASSRTVTTTRPLKCASSDAS